MKLYCKRADLNKALNNVLHAVPTRTTSKILEGILCEIKGEKLYLTATDTNITIETNMSVNADGEGSLVIPARIMASVISKLSEEEVMMDYDDSKNTLHIVCGNSQTELICFDSGEFPKIKIEEKGNRIFLSKETIKKMIRKTAFAASYDDINGILTGVLIEIKEKKIKMVAVDTFRMAIYNAEIDGEENAEIVVPAKMMNEIGKIMSDDSEDDILSLEIIDNKAILKFDNNKVTVNTLNGKYIDYNRIIKRDGNIEIRVKKEEMARAIDRASLLSSSQNNNLIKINIDDEMMNINSLSEEGNIEEKVEVIKSGEDIGIGFNSKYMMDVLKAIDDEEIKINMKDNTSPCIINPLNGEHYLYLILPVRIN